MKERILTVILAIMICFIAAMAAKNGFAMDTTKFLMFFGGSSAPAGTVWVDADNWSDAATWSE